MARVARTHSKGVEAMGEKPVPATGGGLRSSAREAIVASAVEYFHKQGYEATSVQEVVDRARVTKGAFYHYFTSKEDLLLLIHDTFMDHELGVINSIVTSGLTPREALALLIEELVVNAEVYQQHLTIFFEQRRFLSDVRFAQVKAKRDEFEQRVVEIIETGISSGEFRAVESARVLAFGIIGMGAWTYHWYRPGAMSAREIGRMYATTVLDGLTPAP